MPEEQYTSLPKPYGCNLVGNDENENPECATDQNISWSDSQIYQLRKQIEAYKHLNKDGKGGNIPRSFEELQLLTDSEEWAKR